MPVFKLEAIYAEHGDCLLLHYGDPDPHPEWLLIDGGAGGVWDDYLRPRLEQLGRSHRLARGVPLKMVMVSHVDDDHINGVLDLFDHLHDADEPEKVCRPDQLWHNSFDDVLGNSDRELISHLVADPSTGAPQRDPDTEAVVASVRQGWRLRDLASTLARNRPFQDADGNPGLIIATGRQGPAQRIAQGGEMSFEVVAPSAVRVRSYQEKWDEFLVDNDLAREASFADRSAFNLASIVVVARCGGRTMLLTGDARGDHTVNGLVDAGMLTAAARYPEREDFPDDRTGSRDWGRALRAADDNDAEPLTIDLLKMPHHGSERNVTEGFFSRIVADHYLFSGNGNHHNPNVQTLDMLVAGRARAGADGPFTFHFTFTADQHLDPEYNSEWAANLQEVHDWLASAARPANCSAVFRQGGDEIYSITVDLSNGG